MSVDFKRPYSKNGYVAEESDVSMVELLGGSYVEGVAFTSDQLRTLARNYNFDLKDENPLIKAGNSRNLLREVRTDGTRIMAFLAKHDLLEEGVDPVSSLARAIDQSLFRTAPDIWNEDEE